MGGAGGVHKDSRRYTRRAGRLPACGDPLVRAFFEAMWMCGLSYRRVGADAGVSPGTIRRWQLGATPNLGNFIACLEVVGLQLAIAKKQDVAYNPTTPGVPSP